MNVYRVGSFYPYGIVAANDEAEVRKLISCGDRSDPNALVNADGCGTPDWKIVLLDTTKPGVIDVNAG